MDRRRDVEPEEADGFGQVDPQYLAMPAPAMSVSRMRSQPMIQAASSPSAVYVKVCAEPATGMTEANSAQHITASPQAMPARLRADVGRFAYSP